MVKMLGTVFTFFKKTSCIVHNIIHNHDDLIWNWTKASLINDDLLLTCLTSKWKGGVDVAKLPTSVESMPPGKKEGETKMVNGPGGVTAYQWSKGK